MSTREQRWIHRSNPTFSRLLGDGLYLDKWGSRELNNNSNRQSCWTGDEIYPLQVDPFELEAVSSNAGDTHTTGLGAWSIIVEGLDANWMRQSMSANLNGDNVITVPGTWRRINRAQIDLSNPLGNTRNLGEITIRLREVGATQAIILPLYGQTTQCIFATPADELTFLELWEPLVGVGDEIEFFVEVRENGKSWRTRWSATISPGTNPERLPSIKIPPMSDVQIGLLKRSGSSLRASCGLMGPIYKV